jgi:hypothetical protein
MLFWWRIAIARCGTSAAEALPPSIIMRRIHRSLVLVAALAAAPAWAQTGVDVTRPLVSPRPDGAILGLGEVPHYDVPAPEIDRLLFENHWWEGLGLPARYAAPHEVSVTPWSHGVWERFGRDPRGREMRLWRLRITSPGARSLNLGFARFRLPPGARLYVFGIENGSEIGPFTWRDIDRHGELWTPPLAVDDILLALVVPAVRQHEVGLELRTINHGYAGFGEPAPKAGACNVDLSCAEADGWQQHARSVGLISVAGAYYCTAFLVNNTAQDARPLLLTARHCGIRAGNAASVVVLWNHDTQDCRSIGDRPNPSAGRVSPQAGTLRRFQSGARWLADDPVSDFTLLELDDPIDPALGLYLAGWDRRERSPRSSVVIHHPNTDTKRITIDHDPATITSHLDSQGPGNHSHLRIGGWEVGTTEGGSSGSPLFNQDGRVVGLLHGGLAACGNREPDWFGRLGAAWEGGGSPSSRLRDWLDPLGTGAQVLDGLTQSPRVDTAAP